MQTLDTEDIDRIIEMAWEDRTPFEAIRAQFGIGQGQVEEIMRRYMKPSSFRMWRARVTQRKTKHAKLSETEARFKCNLQRNITLNKISKRQ